MPLQNRLSRIRHELKRWLGASSAPPAVLAASDKPTETWVKGLEDETDFWTDVILNPNSVYKDAIPWRLKPEIKLQEYLTELVDIPVGGTVSILDVGAGPASLVGKSWEGRTVHLVAIDPLADKYNALLEQRGYVPYVRTQPGDGEHLSEQFPPNSFDIVFSNNALDHSYDPLRVLQQAMIILKPGGWIFLRHNVNEAIHAGYGGLHQWNFCEENGRFVIWNPQTRIVVQDHLPMLAQAKVHTWMEPTWKNLTVDAAFQKRADAAPDR